NRARNIARNQHYPPFRHGSSTCLSIPMPASISMPKHAWPNFHRQISFIIHPITKILHRV
ncbi:hypothetical protein, partial [Bartonella sp. CL32QHWL-1]|uniref:hypothetical protein n=1 Tax=Bartonella sp. CL32QHWL-1 TaxID=3243524 RepID=UPI0035CF1F7E